MKLDEWIRDVDQKTIDRDAAYGGQCWDLWADYAERVLGVPIKATYTTYGGAAPHGSAACNVFHNASALAEWFTWHGPDLDPVAGDVAFWELGTPAYPGSHVAIVTGPLRYGLLPTMTQNPGPAHGEWLSTAGLIGYLRPITEGDLLMGLSQYDQEHVRNTVVANDKRLKAVEKKVDEIAKKTNAIYDAQFLEVPTSRGTPGGTLVTLREIAADLERLRDALNDVDTRG